ncbi:MAG: hypothetical protein HYR84_07595 [Planctomycetes bacterium]|nr:hypothetical protein [Planctomycetota bacterium]
MTTQTKRGSTLLLLSAFLFLVSLTGCGKSDAEAWRKAQQADTAEAYEAFLQVHPKSLHANKARAALNQLHAQAWQKASAADTEESYRVYLVQFPTSVRARDAREKLEGLKWAKVKEIGAVEGYSAYLKEFPNGTHATEAILEIETAKWHAACSENTNESYAAFLKEHPAGRHSERAREFAKWAETLKAGKTEHYAAFLKEYPASQFAIRARYELQCSWEDLFGKGKGVPWAPAFQGQGPHPVLLFTEERSLHEWHNQLPYQWRAHDPTTDARLVVVLGKQKETILCVKEYFSSNGARAPSITQYQYDLHVRVVEVKTGKTLATKHFQNVGRTPGAVERYELTRTGDPIRWPEVENWLRPWVVNAAPTGKTVPAAGN